MKRLDLFRRFFQVGIFTIGGAYAMLPVAERYLVDPKVIEPEELHESYTVAQTLPGVIAANTATLIGYRKYGLSGAIASLVGVILPSIIVLSVIAALFSMIEQFEIFQRAFLGVRLLVMALLTQSAIKFAKSAIRGPKSILIFVVSFGLLYFGLLQPIVIVALAAILGAVWTRTP
ncbi:MAG: chromate transporter [Bacillota bacterium]|nr:chromate transporter [Bacillota bacterium]